MRTRRADTASEQNGSVRIGPAGDRFEREADRLAAMDQPARSRTGGTVDSSVAHAVRAAGGAGWPAPAAIRRRMERVLGADLGAVRVHSDLRADQLNGALRSRAFTIGADVFVRRSEYRPGSERGDALLAHELAHTVQPRAASVIRRAPSVESMEMAWSEMTTHVEGLRIVDFIERVRTAGPTGVYDGHISRGFTWSDLLAVVGTEQGLKFVTGKWRDVARSSWGAEPQAVQGQHEWIETSQVGYVIQHAARGPNLAGWLMALDALRTPDREVIYPVEKVYKKPLADRVAELNTDPGRFKASTTGLFGAHVGSMYSTRREGDVRAPENTYRPMTTYMVSFHNLMKKVLTTYLNAETDNLQGFLNAIMQFQREQTWGGDIPELEEAKAKQIENDIRERSVAEAGFFGGSTPLQNVHEIQQFARDAKARNAEAMTHRVNAIVQHQSPLGFGSGEYWSKLPPKPVYVTDEFGKTVADYDEEARKAGGSMDTAMEEESEQETPYTAATLQVREIPKATSEPFSKAIVDQYGQAVFKAQQDLTARVGQINAEINGIFKAAQDKERSDLSGVAEETARKAAAAEVDKKYRAIREKIEGLLASHNEARQRLDAALHIEQTKQTTKLGLETLYAKYCADAGQLLDSYVTGVKNLLTG